MVPDDVGISETWEAMEMLVSKGEKNISYSY